MAVPTTDRAYARGEDAPDGLLGVRVALARNLGAVEVGVNRWQAFDDNGDAHGPVFPTLGECEGWIETRPPERRVVRWVGLNEADAINVDAAIQRAEDDHPGYTAADWDAA